VTLWGLGKRREAVDHANALLLMNPNDNQGVRYLLVCWLQVLDEGGALDLLVKAFDGDPSAWWAYAKALREFDRSGATVVAAAALREAPGLNRFVPEYLFGAAVLRKRYPGYYSFGSQEEAILYARQAGGAWDGVAGALEWLHAECQAR
jgi:tetratricopeptide (TPR) repeat protein